MKKYTVEIPSYTKAKGLQPLEVEAETIEEAVLKYAQTRLRGCDGVLLDVVGDVDNPQRPYHFNFLDEGHIFWRGAVVVNNA